MPMIWFYVLCPCPTYISVPGVYIHAWRLCPCPYRCPCPCPAWLMPGVHVHASVHVRGRRPRPCLASMFLPSVHDRARNLCPFPASMSVPGVHGCAQCPFLCPVSICLCPVSMSVPGVAVLAWCPCPCPMSVPMSVFMLEPPLTTKSNKVLPKALQSSPKVKNLPVLSNYFSSAQNGCKHWD